jgi:hypothetical protein
VTSYNFEEVIKKELTVSSTGLVLAKELFSEEKLTEILMNFEEVYSTHKTGIKSH